MKRLLLALILAGLFSTILMLPGRPALGSGNTYYIAATGSDSAGADGSAGNPWATITYALDQVPDGSTILVKPGTYIGRVRLRGTFAQGVVVKSEVPYQARLRNSPGDRVITSYDGCSGITLEGFDIAHTNSSAAGLVVHLDGGGSSGTVSRVTLRNNILHDSYNNDILKINNAAGQITVEGNMFYNQEGSDEHIDVNSVTDVVVQDNIFFNDFVGSGRSNGNNTSSFIVIKDSNNNDDGLLGSHNITVRRNVFLNWEGSTGQGFVRVGEDGKDYYETQNVLVENNLMLGNSDNQIRSPFQAMGVYSVTFRANTIVGDMPAKEFGNRIFTYGANLDNDQIHLHNNIWSDPTGTMGDTFNRGNNTTNLTFDNNLFFNNGAAFPTSGESIIEVTDDANRVVGNPLLGAQAGLVIPRWNDVAGQFNDGSATIRQAFERLVLLYGVPANGSPAIDAGDPAHAPGEDILGRARSLGSGPEIGAVEIAPLTATVADGQIVLHWRTNHLLTTHTWRIEYTGPGGSPPSPVTGISSGTRSFTLTGLTNGTPYTVSLTLMDGASPVADYGTVTVTPTANFVYLPIIQK